MKLWEWNLLHNLECHRVLQSAYGSFLTEFINSSDIEEDGADTAFYTQGIINSSQQELLAFPLTVTTWKMDNFTYYKDFKNTYCPTNQEVVRQNCTPVCIAAWRQWF